AFLARIVVGLEVAMTGQAKRPVGGQHRHGGRRVAGIALLVRCRDVIGVGGAQLDAGMAGGAGAVGGVVVGVAIGAGARRLGWRQGYRLGVAVYAALGGVGGMREAHLTMARGLVLRGDRDVEGADGVEVARAVAGRTVTALRRLVVADLAAAWCLE